MDDKEYYKIKRITSLTVEQLQKNLKIDSGKYRKLTSQQGHDDAEMLLEKQDNFDSNTDFENT